jgi:hypothetical protein
MNRSGACEALSDPTKEERDMTKETVGKRKSAKSGNLHKAARKNVKDGFATVESYLKDGYAAVESYLPTGSQQRAAGGIAAAVGGALLAAAAFGVGPAALAGAAGYLAYRETCGSKKVKEAGPAPREGSGH